MKILKIFKECSSRAGLIYELEWEGCTKQLGYYFYNLNKVKKDILDGKQIDTPYVIFQKDRRVENISVKNERRIGFI